MFLTLSEGVPQPTVGRTLSLRLGGGEAMLSRCLLSTRTCPEMHAHGHAHASGIGRQGWCRRVHRWRRCPEHTRQARLCGPGDILDLMVMPVDGIIDDGWLVAWRRSP